MLFRFRYGVLREEKADGSDAGFDYSKLDYSKLDLSKLDLGKLDVAKLVPMLTPHLTEALKPKDKADDKSEDKPDKGADDKVDPRFDTLRRQNATLQTQMEEMKKKTEASEKRAEEKDRGAQIQGIMSEFTFASPEARAAATAYFMGQVARVKDGEALVGPDGTTSFDKFLRDSLSGPQAFFLAPKNVSGAGAGNFGAGGNKPLDIDNIKPGMSADDLREAASQIAAIMRG
jgi:hypothetical protein